MLKSPGAKGGLKKNPNRGNKGQKNGKNQFRAQTPGTKTKVQGHWPLGETQERRIPEIWDCPRVQKAKPKKLEEPKFQTQIQPKLTPILPL